MFVELLKLCGTRKDLCEGRRLHANLLKRGFLEKNPYIGSTLISMYAKCGMLPEAEKVLEELHVRDVVSWSSLIAGYAQQGQGHEALDCFEKMQREGSSPPNEVTFICILKACGSIGAGDKGKHFHEEIVDRGLLNQSIALGNALIDMYVKCGMLPEAQDVLEGLPVRDVISWSTIIAGYAKQEGRGHEALCCFSRMKKEGLSPNEVTFICVLKACGSMGAIAKGEEIHNEIADRGLLKKSISLGNALVDMYAKCGMLKKAQETLDGLSARNVVSWNALVVGYTQQGQGHEALDCFEKMQREGLSPNEVTFTSILTACGSIGAVERGKRIHDEIASSGLLTKNVVLGTALVHMYARCGLLYKAKHVLHKLPVRNTVSWSALIAGYAQHEQGHEALQCFTLMQKEGLSPDEVTFACILKACGSIGALDKGKQIHEEIDNQGFLRKNVMLGTALVDMYAKCGMLVKAQQVLKNLLIRDVVSWNTIIAGYAQEGHCHEVLSCFEEMEREGLSPNELTFLSVLNACSHSGKLDEAQTFYENMSEKYGITPNLEHHTCMIMVFGCGGLFEKAISVIKTMLSCDHPSVWLALLGACRKWGNVGMGRLALHHALQLDIDIPHVYVREEIET